MDNKKQLKISRVVNHLEKLLNKNKEHLEKVEFVVGVSRGGLILAAMVATKLNKPLVAVYIDKQDNIYFDRMEWLKDKSVLVVDDVVRTGKTLEKVVNTLKSLVNSEINTLTLYSMTEASVSPNYSFKTRKDISLPWD